MRTAERSHTIWSDEEKTLLEQVRVSGKTVKACAHLFPGRSAVAVKQKISSMEAKKPRGHYSWVWDAIVRELKQSTDLTGAQLANKTGCCKRQVMDRLYQHNEETHPDGKGVYIKSWVRANPDNPGPGPWIQCWALGNEPDAPKPALMTDDDRRKRDRMRFRKTAKRVNPFAAALGLVEAPKGNTGRVYIHLTDSKDDEYELEAA
jgi:hypothetical protein